MSKKVAALSIEIHLLGPFHIAVDGTPVEEHRWARRKPKLLVKLLALQPYHQLHREHLMELLWPDLELESAANNLHKAIHQARHALEPALKSVADSHFIVTQGQQVLLRAPGELRVDVEAFERGAAEAIKGRDIEAYEAALALYEGDLLLEDIYEDWAATRREQLRLTHQDLLTKLARLYETRGQKERSIERLKELVALDPSNEESHRQLMRLYALSGDKHLARQQYRQCREALRRQLDAEPEQATVVLYDQIASEQIQSPSSITTPRDEGETRAINSLAVLPLVNASADPSAEYLSDGITESIINNLSQLPELRVMARNTVFRYKGRESDAREVGCDLNVRAVLMGRVLQLGDALVIRTELVDTADGSQLWGEQYNRKLSDILAVQEEISREISEKLRLKLSNEEQVRLAKRYTDNTEAYHLYLKGRYHQSKWTMEGIKKSIEHFNQAIAIDPDYALAYAGLADSYANLGAGESLALPAIETAPKAKAAAMKALEIDVTLAEAHTSLGLIKLNFEWDWQGAEKEFKRALELNPNYIIAHHWYSHYLVAMGRIEESLAVSKRALELDPLDREINVHLAWHYYFARDYDRTIEQAQKTLEIDSTFVEAYWFLGWAYEQKQAYDEAIAVYQKVGALEERSELSLAWLGHAYALSGNPGEARKLLVNLKDESKRRYISPYRVAIIYLGLNEKDKVFEWLGKAYEERNPWLGYLKVNPMFDSLRSDSRFEGLLQHVGLTS